MSATGFDVCVSGSGAVAMSLTLALSAEGWRVAWARSPEATSPAKADVRTYALNARAITLLERLRVWPALKAFSSPVFEMKICGDGGGALSFSAWQEQVAELAWGVDAGAEVGHQQEFLPLGPFIVPRDDTGQLGDAPRRGVALEDQVQHRHEMALARAEAAVQVGGFAGTGLHRLLNEPQRIVEGVNKLRCDDVVAQRLVRGGRRADGRARRRGCRGVATAGDGGGVRP